MLLEFWVFDSFSLFFVKIFYLTLYWLIEYFFINKIGRNFTIYSAYAILPNKPKIENETCIFSVSLESCSMDCFGTKSVKKITIKINSQQIDLKCEQTLYFIKTKAEHSLNKKKKSSEQHRCPLYVFPSVICHPIQYTLREKKRKRKENKFQFALFCRSLFTKNIYTKIE